MVDSAQADLERSAARRVRGSTLFPGKHRINLPFANYSTPTKPHSEESLCHMVLLMQC
jgi:hypothetical protein